MEAHVLTLYRDKALRRTLSSLSPGACFAVISDGHEFYFLRKEKGFSLVREKPVRVDLHFWIRPFTLKKLAEKITATETSLTSFAILVIRYVLAHGRRDRIFFRNNVSAYTLMRKGYFTVLKNAGPDVRRYLCEKGFSTFQSIGVCLRAMTKTKVRS